MTTGWGLFYCGRSQIAVSVTEVADLRIVSFANTDTLLIFKHHPGGWFAPPLKLNSIRYGEVYEPDRIWIRYYMSKPDGKVVVMQTVDELLIPRRTLANALSLGEPKAVIREYSPTNKPEL